MQMQNQISLLVPPWEYLQCNNSKIQICVLDWREKIDTVVVFGFVTSKQRIFFTVCINIRIKCWILICSPYWIFDVVSLCQALQSVCLRWSFSATLDCLLTWQIWDFTSSVTPGAEAALLIFSFTLDNSGRFIFVLLFCSNESSFGNICLFDLSSTLLPWDCYKKLSEKVMKSVNIFQIVCHWKHRNVCHLHKKVERDPLQMRTRWLMKKQKGKK